MIKMPGRFLTGVIVGLLLSCQYDNSRIAPTSGWTEAQKRNYFVDSFAYAHGSGQYWQFERKDITKSFATFFQGQYPNQHTSYYMDPLPYALEEDYVDTTHIDTTRQWIRFIVYSFQEQPYSIVLERKAGRTYLTTKLTDGMGLYHTGQLILTSKQEYPDSLTNSIFKSLDSIGFWRLGRDTTCHKGLDGSEWSIEAIIQGNYNRIGRWAPEDCGNSTTRWLAGLEEQLAAVCDLQTLVQACDKRRRGITKTRS